MQDYVSVQQTKAATTGYPKITNPPDSTKGNPVEDVGSGTNSSNGPMCVSCDVDWSGAVRRGWAVFMAAAVLYLSTVSTTVAGGDAGELVAAAMQAGVAHPPGYPLFILIGHAAYRLVSWTLPSSLVGADVAALAMNCVSALCGAGAVSCCCFVADITAQAFLHDGVRSGGGMATGKVESALVLAQELVLSPGLGAAWAAMSFALSTTAWTYSITAEVFALNNALNGSIFVVLVVYCVVTISGAAEARCSDCNGRVMGLGSFAWANVGSGLVGLSLTNQHTSILFAVPLVVCVLAASMLCRQSLLTPRRVLSLTCALLVGISPYVFLVTHGCQPGHCPPSCWGDTTTWEGFKRHFLREEYGTFQLAPPKDGGRVENEWMNAWGQYCEFAWQELGEATVILGATAVIGAVVARGWCSLRGIAVGRGTVAALYVCGTLVACFLVYGGVFHTLNNLPSDRSVGIYRNVVTRFWQQPNLVVTCLAGVAAATCLGWCRRVAPRHRPVAAAIVVGALAIQAGWSAHPRVLSAWRAVRPISGHNTVFRDFGRHILDPLPRHSLLLLRGDHYSNAVRYVQQVMGFRTDVTVLDMNMLKNSWLVPLHGPVNYPGVVFPGVHYEPEWIGQTLEDQATLKSRLGHDVPFSIAQFLDANFHAFPGGTFVASHFKPADKSWQARYELWPHGLTYHVMQRNAPKKVIAWFNSMEEAWRSHGRLPVKRHDPVTGRHRYGSFTSEHWENEVARVYWEMYRQHTLTVWTAGKHMMERSLMFNAAQHWQDMAQRTLGRERLSISEDHKNAVDALIEVERVNVWEAGAGLGDITRPLKEEERSQARAVHLKGGGWRRNPTLCANPRVRAGWSELQRVLKMYRAALTEEGKPPPLPDQYSFLDGNACK